MKAKWKCILEMEKLNYYNSGVPLGKQRGKTSYVFMRDFSRFVQGLRAFWQEQRTAKYATHSQKEASVYQFYPCFSKHHSGGIINSFKAQPDQRLISGTQTLHSLTNPPNASHNPTSKIQ